MYKSFFFLSILLCANSVWTQNDPSQASVVTGKYETAVILFDPANNKEWVCVKGYTPSYPQKHGCSIGWHTTSGSSALWSNQTANRLDVTNQKLDALIATISENTRAANESKASMEKMATIMNQAIQEIVKKRFDTLPAELLNDPAVQAKLEQLKKEITEDIKASFPPD